MAGDADNPWEDEFVLAEQAYGLIPDSLTPNSAETPLGLGGYDRPKHVVENADEIIAQFREHKRPEIRCAYCDESIQTRNPADALAWFRTHACSGEGVDPVEWSRQPTSAGANAPS